MNTPQRPNDYVTLRELWELFIGNIRWLALSVVVCFFLAISYIVFTPPLFTHQASVLIGSRNNSGSSTKSNEAFNSSGLSMFNTNSDAKSELHIFLSPSLMEQVVRNLKLDYDYSVLYKGVRMVSLYSNSPISIEVDSLLRDTSLSFTVKLKEGNAIHISDLIINGVEMDFEKNASLSKQISMPYGKIKIEPAADYQIFAGQNIYFSKQNVNAIVQSYSTRLTAKISEDDAPIVELSYSDTNHDRANDVLNMLIQVYNESWIKDKNQITVSTFAFIDERLRVIESELGSVDKNISGQ